MGYFDSIDKKKISVEDTKNRYNVRQERLRNEIISDIKDNLYEPDGKTLKPYGIGDNVIDNFFRQREYYMKQNYRYPSDTDPNIKITLPHSKFANDAGTNVLFELDKNTLLKNIIYDSLPYESYSYDNDSWHFYLYRYTSDMDLTNTGVTIKNVWICNIYTDEIPNLLSLTKNNEYITAAKLLLQNLNTDLGKTASGKISMSKLLTAELIDKEYTKNNLTYPSFRAFQKNAMKILEHDFSRQPVYEYIGAQIPVKMNIVVIFDPDIVYRINKIINALPDIFEGELSDELIRF